MLTREDISSLPVPDYKIQEVKSDYIGQLILTPEMVARKIKVKKDNRISIPLAKVFNLSLKEGVIPFEWKEANII